MTQTLTLQEVKLNGRKAYEAGLLTAQLPPDQARCAYKIGDHRCVIGWSLSDETLEKVWAAGANDDSIDRLRAEGLVEFDPGESIWLLQSWHDSWASSVATGHPNPVCEQAFRRALYAD